MQTLRRLRAHACFMLLTLVACQMALLAGETGLCHFFAGDLAVRAAFRILWLRGRVARARGGGLVC